MRNERKIGVCEQIEKNRENENENKAAAVVAILVDLYVMNHELSDRNLLHLLKEQQTENVSVREREILHHHHHDADVDADVLSEVPCDAVHAALSNEKKTAMNDRFHFFFRFGFGFFCSERKNLCRAVFLLPFLYLCLFLCLFFLSLLLVLLIDSSFLQICVFVIH